jgi:hypothetical protein
LSPPPPHPEAGREPDADRLGGASSSLDLQTGGAVHAEALGRASRRPETVSATESWPPNLLLARPRPADRGGHVAAVPDDAPLPFPEDAFDLVRSRRKVVWTVPPFTVERYRPRLRGLHRRIEQDGVLVCHSQRYLVQARRPD